MQAEGSRASPRSARISKSRCFPRNSLASILHRGSARCSLIVDASTALNAHLGLGLAQLALGRLELARASLERARGLNADSPEVLSALGSIYDRLGLHDQARAQLERAHALDPHDPRVLNNLGVAHLLAGDLALAEATLRQSVLQDPRDGAARNNLALTLGLRGSYQEALDSFRESASEQAAQNNLGYCYFLNERYPEAILHYEKALMAEGDDDLIILHNLTNARGAEQESARRRASLPQHPVQPEAAPQADAAIQTPAAAPVELVETPRLEPSASEAAQEATRPPRAAETATPELIVILSEVVDETTPEPENTVKAAAFARLLRELNLDIEAPQEMRLYRGARYG